MIRIKLNSKEIQCREGQSILEVARENGIKIPTLCHQPELEAYGSCWVCSVKVEGVKGFVTSCSTRVQEGMSVITDSPEVRNARKTALELLLSNHYADCDAPCKIACPDHVDIQTYVSLIANGKEKEAVEVIKRDLPFPMSIGRVCPAFCEEECRRMLVDDAVAIRQLKRCVSDLELGDWCYVPERKSETGKRIAVIGAGPAGLTCAYYLSSEGHTVDVFETAPQAGGWLRYGIPEYRLPKKILDREIEILSRNGMNIHYGKTLGKDVFLHEMKKDYDAVFVGIGAQLGTPMPLEGEASLRTYSGVDYLRAVASGHAPAVGKKVAVIGGGDTAIDCARTALRQGADVCLIYRRTRKEMPAEAKEVDAAEAEGVKIMFLAAPAGITKTPEGVPALCIEKMRLGKADSSGRKRPEATGEFQTEVFDTLIAAISQQVDVSWLNKEKAGDFALSSKNTALSDEATMHWKDNIFAGGDFRRGPATAIEAVADGKTAARSIDRFLRGTIMESRPLFNSRKAEKNRDMDADEFLHIPKKERLKAKELPTQIRKGNSEEVEQSFLRDDARNEAERCLECGCMVNSSCLLREYSSEYTADPDHYSGFIQKHPLDDTHAFILRDPNKCIHCGRCIRVCAEIQGPAVLGYIYRGFSTLVGPELGGRLDETACSSCGKCIDVCPTGALLPKTRNYKSNPGFFEISAGRCTECGAACYLDLYRAGTSLLQVKPSNGNKYNQLNICYKGRFAWQNEDLQYTAESLNELKDIPDGTVLHLSPKMPDILLRDALDFAREKGFSCAATEFIEDPSDRPEYASRIAGMEDLDYADEILLIGGLNQMLRARARSAQLRGARLLLIAPPPGAFRRFADAVYESVDDYQSHPGKRQLFIYHRENCNPGIKTSIYRKMEGLPLARVWVNSDYLNSRGFSKLNIPLCKELNAKHVILFGPTPEQVNAGKIYRLPVKAFELRGLVHSDTGEEILL
ncbi:MAG: FAD-dependent oxidoreductase [Candidatus Marinimicrobia bacterium]|nr:FAD-dependent oxidoreductase [Candidatus Neomarinimicrobiota bacterium]